jgi:hypothetical protein
VLPGRAFGEVASLPYAMMQTYGVGEGDVYLNTAPLYHAAPACALPLEEVNSALRNLAEGVDMARSVIVF